MRVLLGAIPLESPDPRRGREWWVRCYARRSAGCWGPAWLPQCDRSEVARPSSMVSAMKRSYMPGQGRNRPIHRGRPVQALARHGVNVLQLRWSRSKGCVTTFPSGSTYEPQNHIRFFRAKTEEPRRRNRNRPIEWAESIVLESFG